MEKLNSSKACFIFSALLLGVSLINVSYAATSYTNQSCPHNININEQTNSHSYLNSGPETYECCQTSYGNPPAWYIVVNGSAGCSMTYITNGLYATECSTYSSSQGCTAVNITPYTPTYPS